MSSALEKVRFRDFFSNLLESTSGSAECLWLEERKRDENRSKRLSGEEGKEVDLKKWPTIACEIPIRLLRKNTKGFGGTCGRIERHPEFALRGQPLFGSFDLSGHGRRRKRRCHQACHVGYQPAGLQVFSFKHPSTQELQHDFLWRTTRDLPEREDLVFSTVPTMREVLIARVHPEILKAELIPRTCWTKKRLWEERYRSIVDLEKHLHRTAPGSSSFPPPFQRRTKRTVSRPFGETG